MEKMKKTAIFFCLNSVKARKPSASTNDLALSLAGGAFRQGQRIYAIRYSDDGAGKELPVIILQSEQVHHPHGADESDCAENTYGRECLDGIQSGFVECGVGHGVRQCQCRHIESNA